MSDPKRIIAKFDIKNEYIVKGINFEGYERIAPVNSYSDILKANRVDEIIFNDILATLFGRNELGNIISKITKNIFAPVTASGGIKSLLDASVLIANGSDKICINTELYHNKQVLTDIIKRFGSQAIVAAVDVANVNGCFQLFSHTGREIEDITLRDHLTELDQYGLSELHITSINKDGELKGIDRELIDTVDSLNLSTSLIYQGGASTTDDFSYVFSTSCFTAVAVSTMLYKSPGLVGEIKKELLYQGIQII